MSKNWVSASKETKEYAEKHNINKDNMKIYIGQTPADRWDCSCQILIKEMLSGVNSGKKSYYVECNRNKTGYTQYNIVCKKCNNIVAQVWAKDDTLEDYFDLHYVCKTDGDKWYGALSLQLSPIDSKIGIECTCGNDTRDFRANNTLPLDFLKDKIKNNLIGREFGKSTSKFKVERIK